MRVVGSVLSLAFSMLAAAALAQAGPPTLALPLACAIGETCFVQSHVDADPAKGAARDFACGELTYDGHDGTDFRIPSLAGVPVAVLAAAPGTVLRVRDGVEDRSVTEAGKAAVAAIGCGNAVVIDHGGGWTTGYCHMARGSVRVKPGERVATGTLLGAVGLSGLTEFPHLHFSVRHDNRQVDPFAHGAPAGSCGGGTPLWAAAVRPALLSPDRVVLNAGFASALVDSPGLNQGLGPELAPRPGGEALVAYVRAIRLRKGDVQELVLTGPDGAVIAQTRVEPLARDRAEQLLQVGRKRPAPGGYVARYRVERDGQVVLEREIRTGL